MHRRVKRRLVMHPHHHPLILLNLNRRPRRLSIHKQHLARKPIRPMPRPRDGKVKHPAAHSLLLRPGHDSRAAVTDERKSSDTQQRTQQHVRVRRAADALSRRPTGRNGKNKKGRRQHGKGEEEDMKRRRKQVHVWRAKKENIK